MDERKKVSRRQERDGLRRLGGKQHSGSGSGFRRADGHTDRHSYNELVEFKTVLRGKRQITLKADDLENTYNAALAEGRLPLMGVELAGRNWVLMTEDDYIETRLEAPYDPSSRGRAGGVD